MTQQRGTEADDASLIREVVAAQFRSLNWSQTKEPDWVAFAQGFLPDARLFPAARPVRHQTVAQFIDRMNRLRAEGKLAAFEEAPLGCEVRVFGNVAVAFAGCEMLENNSTTTRDVSAILLVRDSGTWHVVAQAWDMETDANRIPDALARLGTAR
jgi:hypothetical protein